MDENLDLGHEVRGRIFSATCYGDTAADMPALVRGILCFLVAHFDRYRSHTQDQAVAEIPYGVQMMLQAFKLSALPSQLLRMDANWLAKADWWNV